MTASAKENKVKTQGLKSCSRRLLCFSKRSLDLRSEDLGPGLSLCGIICEVGMAAPTLWTPWYLTRNKEEKVAKTVPDSTIFYHF